MAESNLDFTVGGDATQLNKELKKVQTNMKAMLEIMKKQGKQSRKTSKSVIADNKKIGGSIVSFAAKFNLAAKGIQLLTTGFGKLVDARKKLDQAISQSTLKTDKAFREVFTQLGATEQQIPAFTKALEQKRFRFGLTTEQVTAAARESGSRGFTAKQVAGPELDEILRVMVIGLAKDKGKEIAQAIIGLLDQGQRELTVKNLAVTGQRAVATFANQVLELTDLPFIQKNIAVAGGRLSEPELIAQFTQLKEVLGRAELAGTAQKLILERLGTAREKGPRAALKEIGLTPDALDLFGEDIATVMSRFKEGLLTVQPKFRPGILSKLFGAEAGPGFAGLLRGTGEFAGLIEQQKDIRGSLQRFKTAQTGPSVGITRLQSQRQAQLRGPPDRFTTGELELAFDIQFENMRKRGESSFLGSTVGKELAFLTNRLNDIFLTGPESAFFETTRALGGQKGLEELLTILAESRDLQRDQIKVSTFANGQIESVRILTETIVVTDKEVKELQQRLNSNQEGNIKATVTEAENQN